MAVFDLHELCYDVLKGKFINQVVINLTIFGTLFDSFQPLIVNIWTDFFFLTDHAVYECSPTNLLFLQLKNHNKHKAKVDYFHEYYVNIDALKNFFDF